MIHARSLTKTFGLRLVLKGIDLDIAAGECVGLLGPNGAGKTTLLRILSTLTRPTLGQLVVAGYPLPAGAAEARRRLGVVSHQTLLYGDLSAAENLAFYGRLYGLEDTPDRADAVLELVGLAGRRRDVVRTFSRGMQQRLAIARALLHDPEVLLLDEPYTGLDPDAAGMLDEILRALSQRGRTVLITMHDMARTLSIADRLLILARGVIAFAAPTTSLSQASLAEAYAAAAH